MSSTGDILEIPGSDSTVEILETPCTSDTVGNISYAPFLSAMDSTPCSSGAVTQPSYHGHHIVEADRSLTTCTTCEANKKKRKALLKKHNRLKKKYEALQQSYNKLQVSTFWVIAFDFFPIFLYTQWKTKINDRNKKMEKANFGELPVFSFSGSNQLILLPVILVITA